MSKKKLTFESIVIRKMPGLVDGLQPFENLSPNINIIAGPNASGKSSAAKAIQQLIWPEEGARTEANGRFKINDDQWIVSVDHSFKSAQKNGAPSELQVSMAPDFKSRYVLSLHDLIRGDERDLAHQIQKDAIGGYDIDSAAENLGYKKTQTTTRISEYGNFKKNHKRVEEIIRKQESLQSQKLELADLKAEQAEAKIAKSKADFYSEVAELRKSEADLMRIGEELDTFPDGMEVVRKNDDESIDELQSTLDHAERLLKEEKGRLKEKSDQLEGLNLPKKNVETEDLRLAQYLVSELGDREKEIRLLRQSVDEEEAKKEDIAKTISLSPGQTDSLGFDLSDIKITDQFWSKAFESGGKKRALHNEIAALKEESEPYEKSERVLKGIDSLSKWLQTYSDPEKTPIFLLFLVLIASIGTAAAVQIFGPIGYIGCGVIGLLLFFIYKNKGSGSRNNLSMRESDFLETALREPSSWNADEVSHRLQELTNDLKSSKWQEKLEDKIHLKQSELKAVENDLNSIEEEANTLRQELGAIPGIDEESLKSYATLYWYCTNLKEWHECKGRIEGVRAGLNEKQMRVSELLKQINSIFKTYNLDGVQSQIEAKVRTEELSDLKESTEELKRGITDAEKEIGRYENDISEANRKLNTIFNRIGVESGDREVVKSLVLKIDAYETLKADLAATRSLVKKKRDRVLNHPSYTSEHERLDSFEMADIMNYIDDLEAQYNHLDDITETITKIERDIENTKKEHNLEHALADKQASLEELEDVYRGKVASATGDLLVSHLKKHLGDKNMPVVFQRAKELFMRITKNRYELKVIGTDSPRFSAIDTTDSVGRSLDELSTGTRIQLLMAVRLAFLEKSEGDVKLPILADELLANSDSNRAAAIIDALSEISREGRQIFYFTAQEDEISKWITHLKEDEEIKIHVHVLNKSGGSQQKQYDEPRDSPEIEIFKEIPKPGTLTHKEYGKLLNVPQVNLLRDPVGKLHVWYMVEDPEILYNILKAGPERWGMLQHFMVEEGVINGLDEQTKKKIRNKAALFEKYIELYRQGRPQPIDRGVLEESGAVSDSFIEAVSDKLKELHGNPADLITALKNSQVSGFRTNKIDDLEAYLLEHGYLDRREPMDQTSLILSVQAFISNLSLSKKEAQDFLNRLLS